MAENSNEFKMIKCAAGLLQSFLLSHLHVWLTDVSSDWKQQLWTFSESKLLKWMKGMSGEYLLSVKLPVLGDSCGVSVYSIYSPGLVQADMSLFDAGKLSIFVCTQGTRLFLLMPDLNSWYILRWHWWSFHSKWTLFFFLKKRLSDTNPAVICPVLASALLYCSICVL